MENKISERRVRDIVREELLSSLKEAVDHEAITAVVSNASKLLKAIDAFRSSVGPAAINAVSPDIDNISKTLESMVSNPAGYVERSPTQRVVSFKPAPTEG